MPATIRDIWTAEIAAALENANCEAEAKHAVGEISETELAAWLSMNARIAKHCRRQTVALTCGYMKQLDKLKKEQA